MQADRVVSTVCPFCGVGCNMELHIKEDKIYRVTAPFDSPTNHGNLCVKGRFGYDFIYNPRQDHHPAYFGRIPRAREIGIHPRIWQTGAR